MTSPRTLQVKDLSRAYYANRVIQIDSRCKMKFIHASHSDEPLRRSKIWALGVGEDDRLFWPISVNPDTRVLVWL